jgi:hypothetical protein
MTSDTNMPEVGCIGGAGIMPNAIQNTSMEEELQGLSAFARVCAIRGLAASLPVETLCCVLVLPMKAVGCESEPQANATLEVGADLVVSDDPCTQTGCLLTSGLLEGGLAAIETGSDLHVKYNSFTALAATLARLASILRDASSQRDCEGAEPCQVSPADL